MSFKNRQVSIPALSIFHVSFIDPQSGPVVIIVLYFKQVVHPTAVPS